MARPENFTTELPAWAFAQWEGGKVANRGCIALWSGKGLPPSVGDVVAIAGKNKYTATVAGYYVDSGWLMLWAVRSDGAEGNLAGAELR